MLAAGDGRGAARRRLLPVGRGPRRAGHDDAEFARRLLAQYNVTVLPGSYLAREAHGSQPGAEPHPHGAGGRNRRMRGSRQRIVQFIAIPYLH